MYYGLGNKNIDQLIRAFFELPYNADRWGVISGCTFFSDEYVQLPQWAASRPGRIVREPDTRREK